MPVVLTKNLINKTLFMCYPHDERHEIINSRHEYRNSGLDGQSFVINGLSIDFINPIDHFGQVFVLMHRHRIFGHINLRDEKYVIAYSVRNNIDTYARRFDNAGCSITPS